MENRFLLLSEREKREILDYMPSGEDLAKMSNFFSSFSDHTRLKILMCLCLRDMCVNDLSKMLGLKQTTVSHQLQLLRSQNLVKFTRNGKILVYSLEKKAINDVMLTAIGCL